MKIRITEDTVPIIFLTWVLYEKIIYQLLAYLSVYFGTTDYNTFASTIYYVVYGILAVITLLIQIINRRRVLCYNSVITTIIIILSWTYLTSNNLSIINSSTLYYDPIVLFGYYIPIMVIVSSYKNIDEWIKSLYIVNIFMNICALWFLTKKFANSDADEALIIAYMIALCMSINVYFYYNCNKKNIRYLIIVDLIMLIGAGNRGAIITGISYIVIQYIIILLDDNNERRKAIKIIALLSSIIIIYIFYVPIVTLLSSLLKGTSLSTRVLDLVLTGNMLTSDGRDYIREMIWGGINQMPPFGYGLLGDRLLSSGQYYIHNLEMEIVIDFGWILGIFIILYIGYNIYLTIKDIRTRNAVTLIGLYAIVQLQFSISFLMSSTFWLFLGILWSSKKIISNNIRSEQ